MKSYIKTWNESRILPVFLFFLVVILFGVLPFSKERPLIQGLVTFFLASNLVIGIYTIHTNRIVRFSTLFFSFLVVVIELLNINLGNLTLMILAILCWIIIIGLLLYVFLIKVFEQKSEGLHRIQGGIACYLLIGLLFAFIYFLVFTLFPNAFSFSDSFNSPGMHFYNFVYYSYITLCTVGFGDISPKIPISQSASILEAIVGVLYPTVLIGYLISDFSTKRKS